jgi:hypothetical protein
MWKPILLIASVSCSMFISTVSYAQTLAKNYNLRTVGSQSGSFTGVKSLYNNGASNLSTPVPTTYNGPSQASFNTWLLLFNPATNVYPCYAELDVIRRKSPATAAQQVTYDGWIYAVSTPKVNPVGDVDQVEYIQRDANQVVVNNTFGGGLNVEITYQGNTLAAKRNGVSILTLPNFKCYQPTSNGTLQLLNPVGGYRADYGFEGNTSASVWTNGASIGKMQQRIGNGAYSTSSSMTYPTPQLSTWSNTYNPNDNSGTMILFR